MSTMKQSSGELPLGRSPTPARSSAVPNSAAAEPVSYVTSETAAVNSGSHSQAHLGAPSAKRRKVVIKEEDGGADQVRMLLK
jgi:hypothetical protein